MPFPWGAAIAAGGGIAQNLIGNRAAKKTRRLTRRRGKIAIAEQRGVMQQLLGSMRGVLNDRVALAEEGFNEAGRELERVGAATRRRIYDREKQTLAAGRQQLALTGGTMSPSRRINLQRGVRGATDRTVADVDENLAARRSQIIQNRTQAQLGTMGDLAETYGLELAHEAVLYGRLYDLLTEFSGQAGAAAQGGVGAVDFGEIGAWIDNDLIPWFRDRGKTGDPGRAELDLPE